MSTHLGKIFFSTNIFFKSLILRLINLLLRPETFNFIKTETLAHVLSCEFCKNYLFTKHIWMNSSQCSWFPFIWAKEIPIWETSLLVTFLWIIAMAFWLTRCRRISKNGNFDLTVVSQVSFVLRSIASWHLHWHLTSSRIKPTCKLKD